MDEIDTRSLFRARVPEPHDIDFVNKALDRLIVPENCVLSYDRTLLSQLPEILAEQHGIRSRRDVQSNTHAVVTIDFADRYTKRKTEIEQLPEVLSSLGIDASRWSHTVSEIREGTAEQFEKYTTTDVATDKSAAVALQKDLGMGHHGGRERYDVELDIPLKLYLASVTTPKRNLIERALGESFWSIRIKLWKFLGKIDPNAPTLSIGPRWITEIRYFREILGLKKHIGLDLFSDDPEMVVAGDMHDMPLADNTYGLIFIKNTMDKSYDVRKLVSEMLRVIKPGGIIIIDQNCGHGHTSPLHRSDVQRSANLLRLFSSRTNIKPLVQQDIDIRATGTDGASNNVRLAMQVLK